MILILGRGLRRWWILGCTSLLLVSCSGMAQTPNRPTIVVTTTIWGDVVSNVAGDAATVEVLMPLEADPHEFRPSSRQIARLIDSDLVIANGLGLEQGLLDVLASAADSGTPVMEMAPLLDPLPYPAPEPHDDPHVWMDPLRVADGALLIAERLEALLPGKGWAGRAEAYARTLRSTDGEIARVLQNVPASARKLVTNHDSLEYFADRYGFEVVGVVIPGGSTLSAPSSSELASLVETMKREEVTVVFTETTESADLAEAVAAELGQDGSVTRLFTGSLGGPASGADTLEGLLVTNAMRIAQALIR